MADYLGPFRFACVVCGRTHFMEREADRCCDRGIFPLTPIVWSADDKEQSK